MKKDLLGHTKSRIPLFSILLYFHISCRIPFSISWLVGLVHIGSYRFLSLGICYFICHQTLIVSCFLDLLTYDLSLKTSRPAYISRSHLRKVDTDIAYSYYYHLKMCLTSLCHHLIAWVCEANSS